MGAVQGEGADDTRAAAAETAQKKRKRRGRQKAAPQLKERTRRTEACSSDGGNQTQTACDINLYDKKNKQGSGRWAAPDQGLLNTHTGFKSISQGDASVQELLLYMVLVTQ